MTTVLIIVFGIGLLGWLGVHIGTRLDTSAQRRATQRLVDENRLIDELRRAGLVRRRDPDGICDDCPYR